VCEDADVCTKDACDPETGCVFTPVDCDDGDPNTEDACDPVTGVCIHTPISVPHPADMDVNYRIGLSEAIAYLAGWQGGSNPIAYAIRAAYLWQNGELYVYESENAPPTCWVLAS
ncbi:MAG TPA: hypothetical protein PLL36_14145, partial [Candidatus Hydrogenedentes bacterium]|nr:hypothetical protein [Candidatus Hydrogenedentota bacterium]